MGGDYDRYSFDPGKDFSAVLNQQGKVLLPADWNELVAILDRRWRAETTNIMGRCAVPKEPQDLGQQEAFKIGIKDGNLTIGRGRIYVDGLLAENHGSGDLELDQVLDEQRGKISVPYNKQPHYPNPDDLPTTGTHLVYLDVWQREVTYLEDPGLIEKAVGIDTTTRMQTVWQVKVHPLGANEQDVTCVTPDEKIPTWSKTIKPSGGRLTTGTTPAPPDDNPCLIPPSGGYRGLENHLYRVEIHEGGSPGVAKFKWSRDNGSVATTVTAIHGPRKLAVGSVGRDSVLRFNAGDWVEITDDWREMRNEPGEIARIAEPPDEAILTITLDRDIPTSGPSAFGTTAEILRQRHTRIRRWDQDRNVDTNGLLTVAGGPIDLEAGIQVTFELDPAGGDFKAGDYWVFAARTAGASVEKLEKSPPRGIHHHYCRLALVKFPLDESNQPTDCRIFWPPDAVSEGCECTVCVTADSHNKGTLTIQDAINKVKASGGTVCLGPGYYTLEKSLIIKGAESVRVKGQGWKTVLIHQGDGSAILSEQSFGVTIEEMAILTSGMSPALTLRNCIGVTFQRCIVLQAGGPAKEMPGSPAIALDGWHFVTILRGNVLIASTGIANIAGEKAKVSYLLTAGFYVEDNLLWCQRKGIGLDGFSLHCAETRLSGNSVYGCTEGGIIARGIVCPGFRLDVKDNEIHATGGGIIVGTDDARITNNDIVAWGESTGDGIALVPGLDPTGLDHCQVLGNRIAGVAGYGIALRTHVRSAMIKQNMIDGAGSGGIVMEGDGKADNLSIENNQLLNIAPQAMQADKSIVGIGLMRAAQASITGNTINGVGQKAAATSSHAGIQVMGSSSVRIAGNEVVNIGPEESSENSPWAGIEVTAPFDSLDVVDNRVRRSLQPPKSGNRSRWHALRIRPVKEKFVVGRKIGFAKMGNAFLGVFANKLRVFPQGRELVAIHGNFMETRGVGPAVTIETEGDCAFSDNRCVLSPRSPQPIVEIEAKTIIASGNHVRGGSNIAMSLRVDKERYSVLGNITDARIQINGAALPAPWAQLNR